MRARRVFYHRQAQADLREIRNWIGFRVSPLFAREYLRRIRLRLDTLETASERGSLRDDIRPGLRVIGLMPSISVVFVVRDERVIILRVTYGGQNWSEALPDVDPPA
jgi:toxin ParE1/3/4